MCLIVHKPAGVVIHESYLRDFYTRNKDGFGFMLVDDGKLRVHKSLAGVDRFVEKFKERMDKEMLVHLRMRTHGEINLNNCHPYEVLTTAEGGQLGAVWMMHNGVLSHGNSADAKFSDTWHYIKNYLQPILREHPMMLLNPGFQLMVRNDIGQSNKFTFMTSRGDVVILNKSAGVMWDDIWMSNTYAWDAAGAGVTKTYNTGYQGGYTGYQGGRGNYPQYGGNNTTSRSVGVGHINEPMRAFTGEFFSLLSSKGFKETWKDINYPDLHDAYRYNADDVIVMRDCIEDGTFTSAHDQDLVTDYIVNLAECWRKDKKPQTAQAKKSKKAMAAEAKAAKEAKVAIAAASNTDEVATAEIVVAEPVDSAIEAAVDSVERALNKATAAVIEATVESQVEQRGFE